MQLTINGEAPFRALKDQFSVAPSTSGYQVAFSTERNGTYTLDSDAIVPANEGLVYLGSGIYCWYKLVGNTDTALTVVV